MSTIAEGSILWTPSPERVAASEMARFMQWLERTQGHKFTNYADLWRWSIDDLDGFWGAIWTFFNVHSSAPFSTVLGRRTMPGADWFPGARVNYTEQAFARKRPGEIALLYRSETRADLQWTWDELEAKVGAAAAWLRDAGLQPGDRVAAFLPNAPETVVALLACASIGAIWSSCAPDMGAGAVLDRFKQIEPKVLFVVDGYRYGGKSFDRRSVAAEIARALPSVERVVVLPYLDPGFTPISVAPGAVAFNALLSNAAPIIYTHVPFAHPLWIVYSSGTTGLPKGIVHSHGGIILEHLKTVALHHDVKSGERFLWMSSTGWIVWNMLVSGLMVGATIVLFDANPAYPDAGALWRFIAESGAAHFGCGAAFIAGSMKSGVIPHQIADYRALREISVTGSPLTAAAFAWLYANVKRDLAVASISGGTDVAAGFVGIAPSLPVTAGEIQTPQLGVAAFAFDEHGKSIVNQVGELVITAPMPSMPVFFWNDPDGRRYRESYFEMYPGVWRHGDWIRFTERGTSVIYGRSDTTINRHGIRMGTAEIYSVVEALPEIADSLVVDLEYLGRPSFMPLFVVLKPAVALDDALIARIKDAVRDGASARHVPNAVYAIPEVPRTLTGKKMELPVRKLLLGHDPAKVANVDAMSNPHSFAYFLDFAKTLAPPNI